MNQSRTVFALLAVAIALMACASARLATPSGKPEVVINSSNKEMIRSTIIDRFAANGYAISSDTQNSLGFVKKMDTGSSIIYKTFLGNAYSSDPNWEVNIIFSSLGAQTKVYASVTSSIQNAFGRTDREDMTSGKTARDLQSFLEGVKRNVEGQAFVANRGKIGIGFENQIITVMVPGSAAEQAGLRVGDKLVAADGVALTGEYMHDAALITGDPGTIVTIRVLREGQEIDVPVVRGPP